MFRNGSWGVEMLEQAIKDYKRVIGQVKRLNRRLETETNLLAKQRKILEDLNTETMNQLRLAAANLEASKMIMKGTE